MAPATPTGEEENEDPKDANQKERRRKKTPVIGHGLMLSLSIAKWRNLLNSQLLVYDGDRQAPPDLSNMLPEGTDLDPETWLMHHESMLAFLHRIANASNIQPDMFP
jgi:hypothetical protein